MAKKQDSAQEPKLNQDEVAYSCLMERIYVLGKYMEDFGLNFGDNVDLAAQFTQIEQSANELETKGNISDRLKTAYGRACGPLALKVKRYQDKTKPTEKKPSWFKRKWDDLMREI